MLCAKNQIKVRPKIYIETFLYYSPAHRSGIKRYSKSSVDTNVWDSVQYEGTPLLIVAIKRRYNKIVFFRYNKMVLQSINTVLKGCKFKNVWVWKINKCDLIQILNMNVVVDEWLNHRASGNLTCRPGLVVVLSSTKFETSWITKQMQVNILYGHGKDDWLGYTEMVYNKPNWTSGARSLFWIERLAFRLSHCLSNDYGQHALTNVMQFGINKLGTKAEWRICKDLYPPPPPFQNGGRFSGLFRGFGQTPWPIVVSFGIKVRYMVKMNNLFFDN